MITLADPKMITLADPKMLKSKYMITLGLKLSFNSPQSLIQNRLRALSQGDHLSARFNQHNQAVFPKVIKCLSLGILVIFFMTEQARQAWVELLAYRLCHQSPGPWLCCIQILQKGERE